MTAATVAALRLGQVKIVDVSWGDDTMSTEVFADHILKGPLYKLDIGGASIEVWHGDLDTDTRIMVNRLVVRRVDG